MIGEMNKVLKFERPVKSPDDTGGNLESYEEWFTTRGSKKRVSGFRSFQSGYDQSVDVYEFRIFWRAEIEDGLNKDVRIICENVEYAVQNYRLIEEERFMFLIEAKSLR